MNCPNCKNELEIKEGPFGGFTITATCSNCEESWYGLKDVVMSYLENKTLNFDVFHKTKDKIDTV